MNQDELPEIVMRPIHREDNLEIPKSSRPTAIRIAIEITILAGYAIFVVCWISLIDAFEVFFIFNELLLAGAAIYQVLSKSARRRWSPFFVAVALLVSQIFSVGAFMLAGLGVSESLMFQLLGLCVGSIALRMFVLGPLLIVLSSVARLFSGWPEFQPK